MVRLFCEERVKGPGKFEGEAPESAYFYGAMLDGDGESYSDEFGQEWLVFALAPCEEAWILDAARDTETSKAGEEPCYLLRESDNGFVYGYWASYDAVLESFSAA